MDRLPEDVLPGILRRLDWRSLAACRRACRDFRRAVDGEGLLLPRSLHGIFFNYNGHEHPHLLSRPPAGIPSATGSAAAVDGVFHFMPRMVFSFRTLKDHCNGLFLYEAWNTYYVCNPATRRWARLPERMGKVDYAAAYLVLDPTMSLEYEVVLLPWAPGTAPSWYRPAGRPETVEPSMGLPLPELKMDVFSSRTGRWEARRLVREGYAVATVADVLSEHEEPRRRYGGPEVRYAENWKGALYVHCRGSFVMRLSLSNNIYRATKTPVFVSENEDINTSLNEYDNGHHWYGKVSEKEDYLGRLEKGIYYVTLHKLQIWVWSLNESGKLMEWVLQHHSDIAPLCKTLFNNDIQYFNESWVLEDYYRDSEYNEYDCHGEDSDGEEDEVEDSSQHNSENTDGDDDEINGGVEEDNQEHGNSQQSPEDSDNGDGDEEYSEWNSDDDYSLIKYDSDDLTSSDFYFLGFHPYKEVIFLAESYRVVAYHLGNCKAQYLGHRGPRGFGRSHCATFLESFPYSATPHASSMHFRNQEIDEISGVLNCFF